MANGLCGTINGVAPEGQPAAAAASTRTIPLTVRCVCRSSGVITFLTQMVDGADFVAIMLRAGFSLAAGSIKEYVCGAPGQDAVAGRCAVGFEAGKDFGALPPHWAVGGLGAFLKAVGGWGELLPDYSR